MNINLKWKKIEKNLLHLNIIFRIVVIYMRARNFVAERIFHQRATDETCEEC